MYIWNFDSTSIFVHYNNVHQRYSSRPTILWIREPVTYGSTWQDAEIMKSAVRAEDFWIEGGDEDGELDEEWVWERGMRKEVESWCRGGPKKW